MLKTIPLNFRYDFKIIVPNLINDIYFFMIVLGISSMIFEFYKITNQN